jgi:hypothetical protein
VRAKQDEKARRKKSISLFGWLVSDGWCWFVLREECCWLVAGGWFVVREKYCWLVADKPSEQDACRVQISTKFLKTRIKHYQIPLQVPQT